MDAPGAAVSRDGKSTAVAWMDQRDGPRKSWLSVGGRESRLALDPAAEQTHPRVAIDGEGNPWAVWEESGVKGRSIAGLAPNAKGELGTVLVASGAEVQFPVLAWSAKTGALVAWEVGGGGVFLRRWPEPEPK